MSELKDIVIALETEAKQRTDYVLDNAAEAIKNLCEENDELRIDSKDIIEKLKSELNETKMERDYARREVCKAESSGRIGRFGTAQDHAGRMGWDCFKEAQP
jgi:regulator of replication initiation timing